MLTFSPLQLQKYTNLDQKGNIIAEYIWIDAFGATRSKARVSQSPTNPPKAAHIPHNPQFGPFQWLMVLLRPIAHSDC